VLEAVTENGLSSRKILAKSTIPQARTILTTNTSGAGFASIAEQLPSELRRSWFGTHFFNPPRYMRLLEIIPTRRLIRPAMAP